MNIALTRTEDLLRRPFTVADVRRMIDAGVLTEDERIELVGGEFLVMAAKGYAHDMVKTAIATNMIRTAPKDLIVAAEITMEFARDVLLEPDIAVFPRGRAIESEAGFIRLDRGDCSLVVEVAACSLRYDRKVKSMLYAELGVREFWVVDANSRVCWVHTGPSTDGWSSTVERSPDETLTTSAVPGFSIRLSEIE